MLHPRQQYLGAALIYAYSRTTDVTSKRGCYAWFLVKSQFGRLCSPFHAVGAVEGEKMRRQMGAIALLRLLVLMPIPPSTTNSSMAAEWTPQLSSGSSLLLASWLGWLLFDRSVSNGVPTANLL